MLVDYFEFGRKAELVYISIFTSLPVTPLIGVTHGV